MRAFMQRLMAILALGLGLGAAQPENGLRIAHMGHVNAHAHLGTLAVIEAGMAALGRRRGLAFAAALAYARGKDGRA